MTVEPMTDAELDGLRSKIFAYNRKERSRLRLFGQNVIRILARLDAERTRADAAEAERDAAVARAMPEPRLMRTVEEVAGLPFGAYLVRFPNEDQSWLYERRAGSDDEYRWTGFRNYVVTEPDAGMVGAVVFGPLPDLPTPTAGETP